MTVELNDSKRQIIIMAATRMFLAHGFSKVSMDKIATVAPVSKATLYNYFDSKDALLAEVITQLCAALLQTMNQVTVELNNVESNLHKIASSFVELIFSEEALAMYRLVIAESRDFPELGQLVYDSSAQPVLTRLEHYLGQINNNGRINIANPTAAADAFFSLLKGDRHFQCLLGIKPPPSAVEKQELVNHTISFYLRGVLYANNFHQEAMKP
jgi:TetR/AcrR family transcriptional repressor of mexJK operon